MHVGAAARIVTIAKCLEDTASRTSNRTMAGIQITAAHSQSENMNIYVLKCTNCEKTAVELLLLKCQHRMCQECVGECYVIKKICVQE